MKLLYLHGFRSSPESFKAQKCLAHVQRLRVQGDCIEWYCPQLPPSPKEAMEMVMAYIEGWQGHQMAVIGSSLGGFYAHYVAEHKRCGAVLLNPAVDAVQVFEKAVTGGSSSEEDAKFLQPSFVEELKALTVPVTMLERYFLVVAKGDEVLDYKLAVKQYKGSEQLILEESDHRITDFDEYINDVFEFIGLGQ